MSTQLSGKSYLTEFDCKVYLNSYYPSKGNPNEKELFRWICIRVHHFYDKYNSKWDNKTARLLEFGGGPVIMTFDQCRALCWSNNVCSVHWKREERNWTMDKQERRCTRLEFTFQIYTPWSREYWGRWRLAKKRRTLT